MSGKSFYVFDCQKTCFLHSQPSLCSAGSFFFCACLAVRNFFVLFFGFRKFDEQTSTLTATSTMAM